ncbi:putative transcriptional regulator UXT [Handroanthus impetiginosus]|uniref:Putative transcriptional regulator UXT n=1 Tax=Handroanthus impetiginosus TaxID=429701 RepID=A0A2G9GFB7_9LAMI|nr:putative transcriptional regulator UXT [Handroanthus impetiginosus]
MYITICSSGLENGFICIAAGSSSCSILSLANELSLCSITPLLSLSIGIYLSSENGCKRVDMDSAQQDKVRKFEEFVDRRLKPDLVHAIAERDKIFEQQKIFSDLRRNIENLEKNNVTSLRTLVNLGSEVYMQADVPDTRHIFVDVGLGFHVEFTWSEALDYIAAREERLSRQIEEYTRLVASIKAQIKMVCEGIREILQLPVTEL